jgi:SLT domain-containing protein
LLPALSVIIVGLSGTVTALVSGIGALTGALSTLSGVVAAIPAGLFALGGAFGSVLAVLGPGIKGITSGVKELQKAKSAVSGASNAANQRGIADAERDLQRARADGVLKIQDAERRLRRTRMDAIKDVQDAERQLLDARRDGARSVSDAERNLSEQRVQAAQRERDLRVDLARAQVDTAEKIRDAEQRLQEVVESSTRKQQDAAEKLRTTREGAAEKLATLQEKLSDAVQTAQQREQDAVDKVTKTRLAGVKAVTSAEQKLRNLREKNASDEQELERALADARASAAAELLKPDGNAKIAQAAVTEAQKDLTEFQRQARAEESDAASELADARQTAAENIANAEENLAQTRIDNADRVKSAEEDLNDERIDGPKRVADAEDDLRQTQIDAIRDVRDATESLTEARRDGAQKIADIELSLSRAMVSGRNDIQDAERRLSRARVDSADSIASAERRLIDARISATRSVSDAERNLRQTRTEVARSIADATERLANAQTHAADASAKQLSEYNKLTPVQKSLANKIVELTDKFKELTAATADRAFSFFIVVLDQIIAHLGPITRAMDGFINVLIGVGKQLLNLSNDRTFQDNLGKNIQNSYVILQNLGRAFVAFIDLLNTWTAAAAPFTNWLSDTIAGWVEYLAALARVNQANGKLASFFDRTKLVFQLVTDILHDLFITLKNIGSIGFPFGVQILRYWRNLADSAKKYTESFEGKNAIKKYFADSVPVFLELNRLIGAIIKTIFNLGNAANAGGTNSGMAKFLRALRTEFLPAFERFAIRSAKVFGPLLMNFFRQLGQLVQHLSAPDGPMATLIKMFTVILKVINTIPAPVLKFILTLLILSRAFATLGGFMFGFVGTLSRMSKAFEKFGKLIKAKGLVGALTSNPMLLILLAIAAAAVLIILNWDKIEPFFKAVFSKLEAIFKTIKSVLDKYVIRPFQAVLDFVKKNWPLLIVALINPFAALLIFLDKKFNIIGKIKSVLGEASSYITDSFTDLSNFVTSIWGTITGTITGAFGKIIAYFTALPKNLFSNILAPIWKLVQDGVTDFWGMGRAIGGSIGDGLKSGWNSVVTFFRSIPHAIIANIANVLWDNTLKGVRAFWGIGAKIGGLIGDLLSGGWSAIHRFFATIPVNAIRVLIDPVWTSVKNGASAAWNFTKGIGSVIYDAMRAIIDFFVDLPNTIGNAISQAFGFIWLSVRNGIGKAWNTVFNLLKKFLNKLISAYNFIASKIPGVDEIDKIDIKSDDDTVENLPGGWAPTPKAGKAVPLPRPQLVPSAAEGGILHPVAGGVYRVVEAGHPEGVVPLDPHKRPRAWRIISEILHRLGPPPADMKKAGPGRVTRDRRGRPGFADGSGLIFPVLGGATRGGGPGIGTHSRTQPVYPGGPAYQWQDDDAYDLMGHAGQYVVAIRPGVITRISGGSSNPRTAGFGVTQDGNIFYKHLNDLRVRTGQRVDAGQIIGVLHSATAGGPHLHFAMRNLAELAEAVGAPPIMGGIAGIQYAGAQGSNPFEFLWGKFKDLLPSLPSFPSGMFGDLAKGIANKLKSAVTNAAKKVASFFDPGSILGRITGALGGLFGGGGGGVPAPGDLADSPALRDAKVDEQHRWMGRDWGNPSYRGGFGSGSIGYAPTDVRLGESTVAFLAAAALTLLGRTPVSAREVSALVSTARQESGFHTGIVNQNDVNWINGIPSIGLMQVVGPTFDSYKVPGFENIWDPLHNMMASIKYQLAAYHGLIPQLHGYDVGGVVHGPFHGAPQPILAHTGEWVLNDEQQMRGAQLVGSWSRFRDYIFSGRMPDTTLAFDQGGIVRTVPSAGSGARGAGSTGGSPTLNQNVYTSQVEVDVDYLFRTAEQRLRRGG